jgi:hypothetical protein
MATLEFEKQTATPPTPDPGFIYIWCNGPNVYYVDDTGDVYTLATGVSQGDVENTIANSFVDGSTVDFTYNVGLKTWTAEIEASKLALINAAIQPGDNVSDLNNDADYRSGTQVTASINAHANLTNNPHSVTKSQVGLDNVPNVDATQRSNHTGTQLAATISDLDTAIANYLDRKTPEQIVYDTANYSINTSNTTPAVIVDENFTPLHTGKYKVVANFSHSYENATDNNTVELLLDDVVIKILRKEPKDVGGADGASGTDQCEIGHFEYIFDTIASTSFNIKFQHLPESNNTQSTIKSLDLYVERYL